MHGDCGAGNTVEHFVDGVTHGHQFGRGSRHAGCHHGGAQKDGGKKICLSHFFRITLRLAAGEAGQLQRLVRRSFAFELSFAQMLLQFMLSCRFKLLSVFL